VFRPLHRYLDLDGFPASEEADRTALSIPIHPSMTDDEVTRVVQILGEELA
jgi:dTDP-4-amino-4,6-dideoxygalactose transaminase